MGAEIDRSEVDPLWDQLRQVGPRTLDLMTFDFWSESTEEAPIRKGTLRGSIQMDQQSDYQWIVGTALEYALPVHDGSDPHIIEAVNAQALGPIPMSGTYLGVTYNGVGFFKSVQHPGTDPNPFFDRAQDTVEGKVEEYLTMAVEELT